MAEPFAVTFRVGWSQIDFNAHMRNTAFLELSVDARVTTIGAWLNLSTRKLTAPTEALAAALASLPRSDDYAVLPPRSGPN